MDILIIINGSVLLILLFMSAFFSGSETAFFSLNHLEKDKLLKRSRGRIGAFNKAVLGSPEELLITILTGNMFVNLFFASLMDRLVVRIINPGFVSHAWLYSILIGTGLVLVFGEMTPKSIAIRHSLSFFTFSSRLLFYIHVLLKPLRKILQMIERGIVHFLSGRITREEEDRRYLISATLQIGLRKGILHHSELSVLESFLDFREKTAEEVMIPRTDLMGLDINIGMESVLESVADVKKGEPIPVYRDDVDHIVGYFSLRDILPDRFSLKNDVCLSQIVKP